MRPWNCHPYPCPEDRQENRHEAHGQGACPGVWTKDMGRNSWRGMEESSLPKAPLCPGPASGVTALDSSGEPTASAHAHRCGVRNGQQGEPAPASFMDNWTREMQSVPTRDFCPYVKRNRCKSTEPGEDSAERRELNAGGLPCVDPLT